MGCRNVVQTPVSSQSMAMNAHFYGYGQHSTLTPHHAIKQLWWTDGRIKAKVNDKFVRSTLRKPELDMLDRPVGFGGDLSDDTYLSWILTKARRLFLILHQIRCMERIFSLIDDSWQDEDLPLSMTDIETLGLSNNNDQQLNKKFHDAQFEYLLRHITRASFLEYSSNEHIPMENVDSTSHAVSLQKWSRIHFPGDSQKVYTRRCFSFEEDSESSSSQKLEYLEDIVRSGRYRHEHLAHIWAAYTSDNNGYILMETVPNHTLRTFIDHRNPQQFTRLPKADRPRLLLEWIHCLADTIAYLHHRGEYHGVIRPSNILVDEDNCISFADIGHLRTFRTDKTTTKEENRDYAAPERVKAPELLDNPMSYFPSVPRSSVSSYPAQPASPQRSRASYSTLPLASPTSLYPPKSPRNFSRHFDARRDSGQDCDSRVATPPSPPASPSMLKDRSMSFPTHSTTMTYPLQSQSFSPTQAADIFSLGCVYLDILTFLVHGKLGPLTKLRNKKHSSTTDPDSASISAASVSSRKSSSSGGEPFHASRERVDDWLLSLRKSAQKQPPGLAACVEELLRIVRMMLSPNPAQRPSAAEIRDAAYATLARDAGMENPCCHQRNWDAVLPSPPDRALLDAIERCRSRDNDEEQRESLERTETMESQVTEAPDVSRYSTGTSSIESASESMEKNKRGGLKLFRSRTKGPSMKFP